MKNFTHEEQVTILELARVALADGEIFDRMTNELDIDDKEMKRLQEKIEAEMKE